MTATEGPIMSRIGQPKSDRKAEFWTAVGGRYRVSIDYVVTISVVPGVTYELLQQTVAGSDANHRVLYEHAK